MDSSFFLYDSHGTTLIIPHALARHSIIRVWYWQWLTSSFQKEEMPCQCCGRPVHHLSLRHQKCVTRPRSSLLAFASMSPFRLCPTFSDTFHAQNLVFLILLVETECEGRCQNQGFRALDLLWLLRGTNGRHLSSRLLLSKRIMIRMYYLSSASFW